jgi:hypothetical protein
MSRLSAHSASKNPRACRGWSNTMVRETSTWRMAMSHQKPAARSASVNGSGSRAHQRWQNTAIVPGPRVSQTRCSLTGSSVVANPLSSSVNPIPTATAARLAYSWPLSQILTGYGKYAHTFTNAGPNTSSTT